MQRSELPAQRRIRQAREDKENEQSANAMRDFDGTKAGRLLQSLYAGQKPQISYPKVRTRKQAERPQFIPGGAREGHSDCRLANKKSTFEERRKVRAPAVGMGKRGEWAPIDFVKHRKREDAIERDSKDAARRDYFGIGRTKGVSTGAEKLRLQKINTYGGGKALPEEMLLGKMEMPSKAAKQAFQPRREKGPAELFDQIVTEIQERKDFLEKMQGLGKDKEYRAQVEAEIKDRVQDMERLHKMMQAAGGS